MQHAAPIDRIWQITKSIEQAAAIEEWEKAAELVNERSPLLMSLSTQQTGAALEVLRQVRVVDMRVAGAAQSAQTALNAEYCTAMQATRNVNQYQRVAQF
ncbi:MAG TPA: flagellar protein FliT [Paraburkholderia sp.]|uniref:flagellar protein FliT n=1 Tax=Paraburkholderia sp. TaxID=1926495 RepID=UPI002B499CA6|nr:flagellar protein FliT [Paraburkholderia sp.]HKR40281.1 flagellar protein FliT [Paraburkholderia sp.]